MKKLLALSLATMLLCGLTAIPVAAAPAKPTPLQFKSDGSFKIIHVPDLQEMIWSSAITREFLYDLAETEEPDLFVLGGDNIASGAANWIPLGGRQLLKGGIDSFMKVFDDIYRDFGIPVTMVFGNHDNEGTNTITKAESFAIYAAHESFIGEYIPEADAGTSDKQGQHYGTHYLPVYDNEGKEPMFNLWLFDSGSDDLRGGYSQVQKQQLDWFEKVNAETGKLPSLVFQHIIVPEIYDMLTPAQEGDANTFSWELADEQGQVSRRYISRQLPPDVEGEMREQPCPPKYPSKQLDVIDSAGNVLAMFFGHDHVNTFELKRTNGADLINSSGAGFGAYGDLDLRGVRVITLNESDRTAYETKLITYQNFYAGNALRRARLRMYETLGTFGNILDTVSFRPLLWIAGRF